jgi:hypothetical protein
VGFEVDKVAPGRLSPSTSISPSPATPHSSIIDNHWGLVNKTFSVISNNGFGSNPPQQVKTTYEYME